MSERRNPDAHLGPRARSSNREERASTPRWMAIATSAMAAAFVALAVIQDRGTTSWVLAACWVGLTGFAWWKYTKGRGQNLPVDDGPEGLA